MRSLSRGRRIWSFCESCATAHDESGIWMNAVEIEEAVSKLADAPFDAEAFPYAFQEAFGNKETTLKRLRSGNTNQSDVPGGVLQRNNIHIKVCPEGEAMSTLAALRQSPAFRFLPATGGDHHRQADQ
jgi:hypothetical protein